MARELSRDESPDTTLEDVPPLAFESEEQIVEVLARLRKGLQDKIRAKATSAGPKVDVKKAEELVLKNFYDSVRPIVCANCTIKGRPYAKYIAEKNAGTSQDFDDELHRRVVNYQETVFDLRTENVNLRKEVPFTTAKGVENILDLDLKRLAQLQAASIPDFAALEAPSKPKSRKSVGGSQTGPTPAQAEENFATGNAHIARLLKEIPKLSSSAESAAKVSVDASKII